MQMRILFLAATMSWDSYIDNLIGRSQGSIDRASIIGLNGGGKWTTKLVTHQLVFLFVINHKFVC